MQLHPIRAISFDRIRDPARAVRRCRVNCVEAGTFFWKRRTDNVKFVLHRTDSAAHGIVVMLLR